MRRAPAAQLQPRLQVSLRSTAFSLLLIVSRAARAASFSVLGLTNCKQCRTAVKFSLVFSLVLTRRDPRGRSGSPSLQAPLRPTAFSLLQTCTNYKAPQTAFMLFPTAGKCWQTVSQAQSSSHDGSQWPMQYGATRPGSFTWQCSTSRCLAQLLRTLCCMWCWASEGFASDYALNPRLNRSSLEKL